MIEKVTRKSMIIRPSGRSTDFLSPTFIIGCGFECSYCYCKRNKTEGVNVATNYAQILTEISDHAWFADVEKPNQTHEEYITYDIGAYTDIALHAKHIEWERIFDFFLMHPRAMGSFATKYVNEKLLSFNPEGKIRIRFSLIPEQLHKHLEPNTSTIMQRLQAVKKFLAAGYEVHLNFSPVIVYRDWLKHYKSLFELVRSFYNNYNWQNNVKAEVIFLTHNEKKHLYNLEHKLPGEEFLWTPKIQEAKKSQYGGDNVRYKHDLKAQWIKEWTELHDEIIPWNTIRYCFTFLLLLSQII